jgi:hypothetical protein
VGPFYLATILFSSRYNYMPTVEILHLIYFYILSSFEALVCRKIKDNETWNQRVQKIKSKAGKQE